MSSDMAVELYKIYAVIQRARRALSANEYRLKRKLTRKASREYKDEILAILEVYYLIDYILEKIETRLETMIISGVYLHKEWLTDAFQSLKILKDYQQNMPTEVIDVLDEAVSRMAFLASSSTAYTIPDQSPGNNIARGAVARILEEAKEHARSKIKMLEANMT